MSDISPQPTAPSVPPSPGRRLPADYYAASPSEVRPIFPRWVAIGCGWTSAVILVIGFTIGAVVFHTGLGSLMEMLIGSMQDEITGMYGKDVTAPQRAALKAELDKLRENLRTEKLKVVKLDTVLEALRDASADKVVDPAETVKLTRVIHEANEPPKPKPQPARPTRINRVVYR